MTAASLAWPSSRIVAGWWPDLADLHPQHLWLSSWRLHHVEALVAVRRPCLLDPLSAALLRLLDGPAPVPERDLPTRLQLEPAVASRLVHGLADAGLAHSDGGRWTLTATGHECRQSGAITVQSRRNFTFLDRTDLQAPPHFLPIAQGLAAPLDADATWRFDPAILVDCLSRDTPWKERYQFPRDVEAILLPPAHTGPDGMDWERVVLDRPEHLLVVVAELSAADQPGPPTTSGTSRLVAFPVQPQGWVLDRKSPTLELGLGWQEVFPDLQQPLPAEEWAQAWRSWCQSRALPPAEVDACELMPAGCVLHVRIPPALAERLPASRAEPNRPAPWVLAGSGRTRRLARLEIAVKT
jgi:hypothetical protein